VLIALVGVCALLSPLARPLEEGLGLNWLFEMRGPLPAPGEVVVVTVDRDSTEHLGLPEDPLKWSRSVHTRLVDTLHALRVRAIAFDLHFADRRGGTQDEDFARAIRRAGNVVLFESVRWETGTQTAALGEGPLLGVRMERRVPPTESLARAARGTGALTLPKVPVRVSQLWLFKAEAGDVPSLPMVALQIYAEPAQQRLHELVTELDPSAAGQMPGPDEARKADGIARVWDAFFDAHPSLAARIEQRLDPQRRQDRLLQALVSAYAGSDSRHLNFYGAPGSIRSVPLAELLAEDADIQGLRGVLEDRAVFVGFAERLHPDQEDAFHTVYSNDEGIDISGVEIAATAFANLLNDEFIEPLPLGTRLLAVLAWGMVIGITLRLIPLSLLAPVTGVFALAYLGAAHAAFTSANLWMPLATPLAVQLPLAVLLAMSLRLRELHLERKIIRRAFGYHLPNEVVDRLASGIDVVDDVTQELYGACLVTDLQGYTTLSETLSPAQLHDLMNDYFQLLFEPVRRHDGVITDAVGDSMMAVWTRPHDRVVLRRTACEAALEMLEETQRFRHFLAGDGLPTRLGLHCGDFLLGHVGALDHFEYRAVGDIVNTASRIQALGKPLGARLLASASVIAGLDGLVTRDVGLFLLPGKDRAVNVSEIAGIEAADVDLKRLEVFGEGLVAFRMRDWKRAEHLFRECLTRDKNDGPARFYLDICHEFAAHPPPESWQGEIRIDVK
jgi:adenylate cyclase